MKIEEILSQVMTEISRAEEKHPNWPTDLVRGALIVCEESGELAQAVNNYDAVPGGTKHQMILEAVQTAVSAIRFLKNLQENE